MQVPVCLFRSHHRLLPAASQRKHELWNGKEFSGLFPHADRPGTMIIIIVVENFCIKNPLMEQQKYTATLTWELGHIEGKDSPLRDQKQTQSFVAHKS